MTKPSPLSTFQLERYNRTMTRADFRERHPDITWKPNLIGHQQKRVGKKVYESLDERVIAVREEIAKMKSDQEKNQNPLPNS